MNSINPLLVRRSAGETLLARIRTLAPATGPAAVFGVPPSCARTLHGEIGGYERERKKRNEKFGRARCGNRPLLHPPSRSAERRLRSHYCNFHSALGRPRSGRGSVMVDRIANPFPSGSKYPRAPFDTEEITAIPPPSLSAAPVGARKSLLFSARRQYEFIILSIRVASTAT